MGSPCHWEVTFEQNPNAGSDLMETQKTGLWNSHQGKDKQEIKLRDVLGVLPRQQEGQGSCSSESKAESQRLGCWRADLTGPW